MSPQTRRMTARLARGEITPLLAAHREHNNSPAAESQATTVANSFSGSNYSDDNPSPKSIDSMDTNHHHFTHEQEPCSPSSTFPLISPRPQEAQNEGKPLPKNQILLLCLARLIEPIAFFSIFPYVQPMVQQLAHLGDDQSSVGFYTGLIESLFSVTQMVVMLFWGRLADRIGRKPVLCFSLLGLSCAISLFGLARSLAQMILFRCLAGVFAGTIVTVRTMISEHSTKETQARAFSWFAFSGNLGIFLGPLLGGALADPGKQFPNTVFARLPFFEKYPYALSGFVVTGLSLITSVICFFFVQETLAPTAPAPSSATGEQAEIERQLLRESEHQQQSSSSPKSSYFSTSTSPSTSSSAILPLLRSPGVPPVLYNYAHVMILAYAYTAITPVFWFTKVSLGGYGFSPLKISLFMGLMGASQAVWLLLAFPLLQKRWGTNGVMRACGNCYPFFFAVFPLLGLLIRYGEGAPAERAFWVLCPALMALGVGVSMAFTGVQLALNDVAPNPQSLGTLNALALTGVSGLRAVCPWAFTSLFAVGVKKQLLNGYFAWVILIILAAGFTVSTRFLPRASEMDGRNGIKGGDVVAEGEGMGGEE